MNIGSGCDLRAADRILTGNVPEMCFPSDGAGDDDDDDDDDDDEECICGLLLFPSPPLATPPPCDPEAILRMRPMTLNTFENMPLACCVA